MFKVSPASLQTFIDKPNCVLVDCVQYNMGPHSKCVLWWPSSTDNTIITTHVFLASLLGQSDCLAADHQGQGDTRLTNAICYP